MTKSRHRIRDSTCSCWGSHVKTELHFHVTYMQRALSSLMLSDWWFGPLWVFIKPKCLQSVGFLVVSLTSLASPNPDLLLLHFPQRSHLLFSCPFLHVFPFVAVFSVSVDNYLNHLSASIANSINCVKGGLSHGMGLLLGQSVVGHSLISAPYLPLHIV